MRMRFILLSFLLFISCDRRELTYFPMQHIYITDYQ